MATCAPVVPHAQPHTTTSFLTTATTKLKFPITLTDTRGIIYDGPGSIDTGSTFNLFPASMLSEDRKSNLTPTRHTVYGVAGKPMQALGRFTCSLKMENGSIKENTFFVLDAPIPVLLGMDTLEHPEVKKFRLTNSSLQLHTDSSDVITVTLSLPALPSLQPDALQRKLEWLKSELGLNLPVNHACKNELQRVVELLES